MASTGLGGRLTRDHVPLGQEDGLCKKKTAAAAADAAADTAPLSSSEQAAGGKTHREAKQSDSFSPTTPAPPLPASEAPRPVKKVTLQPSVASRDGYYFKMADGRIQGPLSADKFEWYRGSSARTCTHALVPTRTRPSWALMYWQVLCCAYVCGLRHRQPAGVNARGGSNPE
jgi:hypothetical protein